MVDQVIRTNPASAVRGPTHVVRTGKTPVLEGGEWRRLLDAIPTGCHTFRTTGITAYLESGGTLEHAQAMAAHESPRTTKLYDRTKERLTLDEIERVRL